MRHITREFFRLQTTLWINPVFLLSFLISACSSNPPKRTTVERFEAPPSPAVTETEEGLISRAGLGAGEVGFLLWDLDRKQALAERNAERLFLPASVQKLTTALYALETLRPTYRYPTTVLTRGKIDRGTLRGDLYLKGSGDPLLLYSHLLDLVEAVRKKGIRAVDGKFIFDDALLPSAPRIHEAAHEESAPYNAGLSALSSEFNRVTAQWTPGASPGVRVAQISPPVPWMKFESGGPSPDPLRLKPLPDVGETIWFAPDLKSADRQDLPVRQPARFTATLFAEMAAAQGLRLPSPERGVAPKGAAILASHESAPLVSLVEADLEFSNNVMAELLLLSAARKAAGAPTSREAAAQRLGAWLQANVPGASWKSAVVNGGSGFGAENRLSPKQVVSLLAWADRRTYAGRSLVSLLPAAGWKGTLKDHLTGPATRFRVWAKTGTMNFGRGLAGYVFTKSGRKLAFAVFSSDLAARTAYEALKPESAEWSAMNRTGGTWIESAKALEAALLAKWIAAY